jgi:hypothetical protein
MEAGEFRRLGHALVDSVAAYLEALPSCPVTTGESPGSIRMLLHAGRRCPKKAPTHESWLLAASRLLFEHSLFRHSSQVASEQLLDPGGGTSHHSARRAPPAFRPAGGDHGPQPRGHRAAAPARRDVRFDRTPACRAQLAIEIARHLDEQSATLG